MILKDETVKKILFWTAVLVLPGGTLLLAYKYRKALTKPFNKKELT